MIDTLRRAARRVLSAALPNDLRDDVLGDLDDELAERISAGDPARHANVWFIRQAIGSLPSAVRLRVRPRIRKRTGSSEGGTMPGIWQDVLYAARMMRRAPVVATAAIATLALGIGSTTAIFSVVHATLLAELPFHQPDRIVRVYETFRNSRLTRGVANPSNFEFWERHATSFTHLAAMRRTSLTLTGAGDATRLATESVTPAFFDAIGVSPVLGRRLTDADVEGAAPPVLLSHALWTTRFGADPAITSRTITLDGTSRPIVGVMPPGFAFPNEADLWQSLTLTPEERTSARSWFLGVVARLKPGVTVAEAQAEMDTLSRQLQAEQAARQKDRGAYVVALHEDLVFRLVDGVWLLQGAVLLVLLIAVANIASLMLANSLGRGREFGIRTAIGAGRGRLVRQVLTESLLLGLVGAGGGAALAVWGVRALVALSPLRLPTGMEPSVDGPVLAFALAVGLGTSVLFGVAPAFFASRADASGQLKEGTQSTVAQRRGVAGRFRAALVVGEVALAVTLLAGAALLIRSFTLLLMQDVGFRAGHVLTAQTTLPAARYDTPGKRAQFWRDMFERLEALPGVTAAGGSTALPFSRWEWQTSFRIVGRETAPAEGAGIRTVHPGYFATLGIPLLRGRGFAAVDHASSEPVVIVNDAFARLHLNGLDPVGRRIRLGSGATAKPSVIVGVAGNTRHVDLEEDAGPEIYRPLAQAPPQMLVLAIRTSGEPRHATSIMRAAIQSLDPDLPVEQVMTMDALIGRTVAERRFYLMLMAFFSTLAVVVSVVGIYGVMAHVVGQRAHEIGIRMALGAAPRQIEGMVLRSGGALVGAGLALGIGGALLATGVLRSLLFGVTARDPLTLAAAVGVLGALGLMAAYVPARRARRLDPIAVLRAE